NERTGSIHPYETAARAGIQGKFFETRIPGEHRGEHLPGREHDSHTERATGCWTEFRDGGSERRRVAGFAEHDGHDCEHDPRYGHGARVAVADSRQSPGTAGVRAGRYVSTERGR